MSQGHDIPGTHTEYRRRSSVRWAHRSSRILLTILFLLSLNIVACYDRALRMLLHAGHGARRVALKLFGC
jgi:hypothetical protein